jgi:hypothetical protein
MAISIFQHSVPSGEFVARRYESERLVPRRALHDTAVAEPAVADFAAHNSEVVDLLAPQALLQRPSMLRALLALGCAVSLLAAVAFGQPELLSQSDPDLAWLMRGMSLVKASLVTAIVALLAWRFGRPMAPRIGMAYVVGAWLMSGATVLIWQLTLIGTAAAAFHLGELLLLITLWRDHKQTSPA